MENLENLISKWIKGTYEIDENGYYNVEGDVKIGYWERERLPIKFGKVSGDFLCLLRRLTSLEGCPKEVGGNFNCSNNKLMSLEGCPEKVGENFYCQNNSYEFTKEDVQKVCVVKGDIIWIDENVQKLIRKQPIFFISLQICFFFNDCIGVL